MKMQRKFWPLMVGATLGLSATLSLAQTLKPEGEYITFGFSTSSWGRDWDLLLLLENAAAMGISQIELGNGHAHGIAPALTPEQRTAHRDQFQEAGVMLAGMQVETKLEAGDDASLATVVDIIKQQIRLSHDVGGSGVRVNLGDLKGNTALIAKTAAALKELGEFAIGFGQEIRIEAWAGEEDRLADVTALVKAADDNQVRVAFGVRNGELAAEKLAAQFTQLQACLGDEVLIDAQPEGESVPFDTLAKCLVAMDYDGRVVLTAQAEAADKVTAAGRQKVLWEQRLKKARTP